jgi:hypothetical protein
MEEKKKSEDFLGGESSIFGHHDQNRAFKAKGNLEIEFAAWGDDIGRLVVIPRDEFTKAAFNLLQLTTKPSTEIMKK